MRLAILLIFMLTVWDIPVSSSSEIDSVDSELIEKVHQLEKELQELKKQHQETIAPKGQKEEMPSRTLIAEATKKTEKPKDTDAVKDDNPSPPEEPNFTQSQELLAQAQIFLNQKRLDQAKAILQNLCDSYP